MAIINIDSSIYKIRKNSKDAMLERYIFIILIVNVISIHVQHNYLRGAYLLTA